MANITHKLFGVQTRPLPRAVADSDAGLSTCGNFRGRVPPRGQIMGKGARMAEFDRDQLERLMVKAFRLLGKPEGQAQELARAILRAAERPQFDVPEPLARDPK